MKEKFREFAVVLKRTFKGWNEDDPFRQSAVIAYYAIFSLPALLVLIINVVGFFFEREAVNGEISRQISGLIGPETAKTVEGIIAKTSELDAGIFSTIIAVATIIFGATGVFVQLQKTLNVIWDVEQKPNQGFLVELRHRLFSFGLILSIGFLLLVSLVISSLLAAFSHWLETYFPPAIAYLFYGIEFLVSLSVISVLFLLMFRFLPDVKMGWRSLVTGSVLTGFLFILGKYGLSFYFGKAEPASVYGAAGSIILLLLWVSYSSMILFFGAEFTKQYAVYRGTHIEPKPLARRVDDPEAEEDLHAKSKEPHNRTAFDEDEKRKKPSGRRYDPADAKRADNTRFSYNIRTMKKIKSRNELAEEIRKLESRAEIRKLEIREKLRPARVVQEILQKRKTIPRPSNKELAMEGFDFAIHFLTDQVLLKNSKNETLKSLSVYLMREIAKNYVYGKSEHWVDHMKEVLNITNRGEQSIKTPKTRMEDPVDEYYSNM